MTFGEKLYKLRKAQGFSQEALAEKLHTSRQAVSKWENDNGYPETEKIILISKLFQISLDDRADGGEGEWGQSPALRAGTRKVDTMPKEKKRMDII